MLMNMHIGDYQKEMNEQMEGIKSEIRLLKHDFENIDDSIVKSQVKTFLEKKQAQLLNIMGAYYGTIR